MASVLCFGTRMYIVLLVCFSLFIEKNLYANMSKHGGARRGHSGRDNRARSQFSYPTAGIRPAVARLAANGVIDPAVAFLPLELIAYLLRLPFIEFLDAILFLHDMWYGLMLNI